MTDYVTLLGAEQVTRFERAAEQLIAALPPNTPQPAVAESAASPTSATPPALSVEAELSSVAIGLAAEPSLLADGEPEIAQASSAHSACGRIQEENGRLCGEPEANFIHTICGEAGSTDFCNTAWCHEFVPAVGGNA